ncbi:MAG TPA: hypothetical protein PK185_13155 [Cyclobacteriaceae bacterium]|nr:hypothetical protein [Cyclobacteriaceae bacterium]HRK54861.1 hypothetical protein [Cyclobacteriaceae bacterium]
MINDIEFPEVKNVTLAIVKEEDNSWKVYLINKNQFPIENTLVSSKGYGESEDEKQQTSTLRHFLETIPGNDSALVEPIDPTVFHLNNEYWVSYYVDSIIYDKRFLFVPDAIKEENMIFIKELDKEGVLHS